jgi:hypothetical protein
MSYSLVPYVLDLEALGRAVGGADEALIAAIIQRDPEDFAEGEPDAAGVSLGEALRALVMGGPFVSGAEHQYGYALERLCEHLGERLDRGDVWADIRWDVIEGTGMEEILDDAGPPVPLPKINSYPAVGHLTVAQVAEMAASLAQGHLTTAAPSGRKRRPGFRARIVGLILRQITRREPLSAADLRELMDEFEEWLRQAAAKKQGLVFFYY